MTTPRDFTKNKGWGHAENKKYRRELFVSPLNNVFCASTFQRHPKQLKPSQASLFDLLPTDILMDTEICISGLKYCDKCKAIVSNINYIYITPFSSQYLMTYGHPTIVL